MFVCFSKLMIGLFIEACARLTSGVAQLLLHVCLQKSNNDLISSMCMQRLIYLHNISLISFAQLMLNCFSMPVSKIYYKSNQFCCDGRYINLNMFGHHLRCIVSVCMSTTGSNLSVCMFWGWGLRGKDPSSQIYHPSDDMM